MNTLSLCQRVIREKGCTKVIANRRDIVDAITTNVRMDNGKKDRKGKKNQKGNEEMMFDPTPCEVLTSHPPSTTEENEDELGYQCHRRRGSVT